MGCRTQAAQSDQVCFHQQCYSVEIAGNESSRQKGLMFRESLDQHSGMLFLFPSMRVQAFWMKNTLIPLDIIWMDHSRKIIHISTDVQPCKADPCPTYSPKEASLYVLELNSGEVSRAGLKLGDSADFKLRKN